MGTADRFRRSLGFAFRHISTTMKSNCHNEGEGEPRQQRLRNALGWLVPGILLATMPKCPMCLAAYVALACGIGISLPVASFLRTTLIVLCLGSLLFPTFRFVRMRLGQRRSL